MKLVQAMQAHDDENDDDDDDDDGDTCRFLFDRTESRGTRRFVHEFEFCVDVVGFPRDQMLCASFLFLRDQFLC